MIFDLTKKATEYKQLGKLSGHIGTRLRIFI